jgi:hypothetical protein
MHNKFKKSTEAQANFEDTQTTLADNKEAVAKQLKLLPRMPIFRKPRPVSNISYRSRNHTRSSGPYD